ncbi:oxidoreductase [Corchorus olitorius]|uniref:Oxidoreductase n=1 Tax=Corchorus olitorius TaxID=93759 RepID=A0A1R3IB18_9ROSI|nr:oxidoreductase [Corchorus olitorius]
MKALVGIGLDGHSRRGEDGFFVFSIGRWWSRISLKLLVSWTKPILPEIQGHLDEEEKWFLSFLVLLQVLKTKGDDDLAIQVADLAIRFGHLARLSAEIKDNMSKVWPLSLLFIEIHSDI